MDASRSRKRGRTDRSRSRKPPRVDGITPKVQPWSAPHQTSTEPPWTVKGPKQSNARSKPQLCLVGTRPVVPRHTPHGSMSEQAWRDPCIACTEQLWTNKGQQKSADKRSKPPWHGSAPKQAFSNLNPSTHVLLSPGNQTKSHPKLLIGSKGRPTVCVMGPYRSGTHTLVEYLDRFFEVRVEPNPKGISQCCDTGTVALADGFQIWKHSVPLRDFNIPSDGARGGRTVVLLLVREVSSWLESLSKHAYELFPCPQRKRKKGHVEWMLDKVKIRSEHESFKKNPFPDEEFESAVSLWVAYAEGYLFRHMTKRDQPRFAIVRFEDLTLLREGGRPLRGLGGREAARRGPFGGWMGRLPGSSARGHQRRALYVHICTYKYI